MKALFLSKPMEQILQTPSAKLSLTGIVQTLSAQSTGSQAIALQPSGVDTLASLARLFPLPWSTYVRLLSVKTSQARNFYETEALRCGWTVRQLGRQIDSQFYERIALSRNISANIECRRCLRT